MIHVACKREGKENPQRLASRWFRNAIYDDAVSSVSSQSAVRRDLELRNVQGTARRPRGSAFWWHSCGVTASCPLGVEEVGTDSIRNYTLYLLQPSQICCTFEQFIYVTFFLSTHSSPAHFLAMPITAQHCLMLSIAYLALGCYRSSLLCPAAALDGVGPQCD